MISKIKENKITVFIAVACLVIGVAFGRWAAPEKVEYKKEIVEVTKEIVVEKKVFIKEEIKKEDKKKTKIVKKITKPDGTIIEETIESEEDSSFVGNTEKDQTDSSSESESSKSKTTEKETTNDKKKLQVSILAGLEVDKSTENDPFGNYKYVYGVHAAYSFFGPISVGAFGTTSNQLGLSVGISF